VSQKWVKSIRTVIQSLIALISVSPFLVSALGLSATVGVGATVLLVSSTLARIMASPMGETLLRGLNLHSDGTDIK